MNTQFKSLFSITVSHTYYSENCQDIRFILPLDTAQLLRNGKLLARELNGKLYVLFEADDAGVASVALPGKTMRIGLQIVNPFFSNFTNVDSDFESSELLYRNSLVPTVLDAPEKVTLTGRILSHALTDGVRPVTVILKDADKQTLQSDMITSAHNRFTVSYDLAGHSPGTYMIEEVYQTGAQQIAYYSDVELMGAGIFGILEVKIDSGFYTSAAEFQIAFGAKDETLNYYLVVANYSDEELNQLSVSDAGFNDDKRPEINFTKLFPSSFTSAEISPDLLMSNSAKVVLFKSGGAVARREKARKKIQLKKNEEILITNLPQPGPEKPNADLIISVAKPKS